MLYEKNIYCKYPCDRDTGIFWRIFRLDSGVRTSADDLNLWR